MKIERRICLDDLFRMCIENRFYTCGDAEDYQALLGKCKGVVSDSDIEKIATDIAEHSYILNLKVVYDGDSENNDDYILDIATMIANKCCHSLAVID